MTSSNRQICPTAGRSWGSRGLDDFRDGFRRAGSSHEQRTAKWKFYRRIEPPGEISRYYLITVVDRTRRPAAASEKWKARGRRIPLVNPIILGREQRDLLSRETERKHERLSTTSNEIHLPLKVRFFFAISSDISHLQLVNNFANLIKMLLRHSPANERIQTRRRIIFARILVSQTPCVHGDGMQSSRNGGRYRPREEHMRLKSMNVKNRRVSRCFMHPAGRWPCRGLCSRRRALETHKYSPVRAHGSIRVSVRPKVPCWQGDFEFSYPGDHSYLGRQKNPDLRSSKNFRISARQRETRS